MRVRRQHLLLVGMLALLASSVSMLFIFPGVTRDDEVEPESSPALRVAVRLPQLHGSSNDEQSVPTSSVSAEADTDEQPAPTRVLSVRVRAADDSEPVAGANVFLTAKPVELVPWTSGHQSDEAGGACLRVQDEQYLNVTANGFCPWQGKIESVSETAEVAVYLERGITLRGQVRSRAGGPIPGAEVAIVSTQSMPRVLGPDRSPCLCAGRRCVAAQVTTDAHGRFIATGLRSDVDLWVTARKPMWEPMPVLRELSEEEVFGREDVMVELDPMYGVRVVSDSRKGVTPGILWEASYKGGGGSVVPHPTSLFASLAAFGTAKDDAQGSVVFERVLRGGGEPVTVALKLRSLCFETQDMEIPVEPGTSVTRRVSLTPRTGRRSTVRFFARFEGGEPFSGPLQMYIQRAAESPARILDLEFRDGESTSVTEMLHGTYTVWPRGDRERNSWWSPAGPPQSLTLDATTKDDGGELQADLVLRGGGVKFDTYTLDGTPIRGYGAGASSGTGGVRAYWDIVRMADERAGRPNAGVLWLPPGSHKVYVDMPGLGFAATDVEVPATGEVQTVTMVVGSD